MHMNSTNYITTLGIYTSDIHEKFRNWVSLSFLNKYSASEKPYVANFIHFFARKDACSARFMKVLHYLDELSKRKKHSIQR